MYNHAPKDYICPICVAIKGKENKDTLIRQGDFFYKDDTISAFINSRAWPNNLGAVIIVSNQHFENIYDIPDALLSRIHLFSKKVAEALKVTYKCDGVTIRQHNEPAGSQDAWHYHLHIFPRYTNDKLYQLHDKKRWTEPQERKPFADKLRKYFSSPSTK